MQGLLGVLTMDNRPVCASVSELNRSAAQFSCPLRHRLLAVLRQTLVNCWHQFTMPMSKEPTIELITDRQGQTWWCAYDPYTRLKVYLSSEEDVLIWLEQRPYM